MSTSKLTPKQQSFVQEYLIDLNATQAAIRAGYSVKAAATQGWENLRKPEIQAAIQAGRSARAERTELSQDWIIDRLRENVERAMQIEPVRDNEGTPTGEYVYAGAVANKALELLGRHKGIFVDRLEHSGPAGGPIPTAEISDADLKRRATELTNRIAPLVVHTNGNGKRNGNGNGH